MKIAERIEADPAVHHGKPVIAGTRVPVHMVLGLLANGLTPEEIIRDYYDHITKEDILACLRYAQALVEEEWENRLKDGTRSPAGTSGSPGAEGAAEEGAAI
jgi:uncharacterized protein (DUF433 family)